MSARFLARVLALVVFIFPPLCCGSPSPDHCIHYSGLFQSIDQTVSVLGSEGGITRQDVNDAVSACQRQKHDFAHVIVHTNQLYVAGAFKSFQTRLQSILMMLEHAVYSHIHEPIPDVEFVLGVGDVPMGLKGAWNMMIRRKDQRSNFLMPNHIFYHWLEAHLRPWRKILTVVKAKEEGRSFHSKPFAKMFWKGAHQNDMRKVCLVKQKCCDSLGQH